MVKLSADYLAELMAETMVVRRVGKMAGTMVVRKVGKMVANWVLHLAVLSVELLVALKALRLVALKVASTVVSKAV